MNKVQLIGRLTRDIEIVNFGDKQKASFTIAVQRNYKNTQGTYDSDFISCNAWAKTAELLAQYHSKGNQIAISGRIITGSYDDKDGKKVYTTDVVVEDFTFLSNKEVTKTKDEEQELGIKEELTAKEKEQLEMEITPDDIPW